MENIENIELKAISRQMMVVFLNQNGETVFTKESTDDIINRINKGYGLIISKTHYQRLKLRSQLPQDLHQLKNITHSLLFKA